MAKLGVFLLCVVLSFAASEARKACPQPDTKGPQVPCLFIFGDSLVDNGNNNGILTLARADYSPYGVDFPQGATGRFTNGRTFVDILGTIRDKSKILLQMAKNFL